MAARTPTSSHREVLRARSAQVEPDHGRSAAARIPNAQLLELDTGTHFAFYTHPDADRAQARAIEYLDVP